LTRHRIAVVVTDCKGRIIRILSTSNHNRTHGQWKGREGTLLKDLPAGTVKGKKRICAAIEAAGTGTPSAVEYALKVNGEWIPRTASICPRHDGTVMMTVYGTPKKKAVGGGMK
jgi:hypothetical protein